VERKFALCICPRSILDNRSSQNHLREQVALVFPIAPKQNEEPAR
jgi:hypothetical protein